MMLGNFHCQGGVRGGWVVRCKRTVPGRPSVLVVGAGGLFGLFSSRLSFLYSFSVSLGDGPIQNEILSQRAVKPKTTNQSNARAAYKFG